MSTKDQIKNYIESQPESKRNDMQQLHKFILQLLPRTTLWFLDGRNNENKIVTNPNIGYGKYSIKYADGSTKDFYQVGMSANTSGISVYIMGIKDKTFLANAYGKKIGKASVTGYCIKFKHLKDINMEVLADAIKYGVEASTT
ncbi:MAG: DUF1801 domain-containing protein [Bacteroidetes bacterium]|nr:DUF1801 domain-containing protein [Bacteroidota bacterium]